MHRTIVFFFIVTLFCSPAAFALYDAPPNEALAAVQGEWRGTLPTQKARGRRPRLRQP